MESLSCRGLYLDKSFRSSGRSGLVHPDMAVGRGRRVIVMLERVRRTPRRAKVCGITRTCRTETVEMGEVSHGGGCERGGHGVQVTVTAADAEDRCSTGSEHTWRR